MTQPEAWLTADSHVSAVAEHDIVMLLPAMLIVPVAPAVQTSKSSKSSFFTIEEFDSLFILFSIDFPDTCDFTLFFFV